MGASSTHTKGETKGGSPAEPQQEDTQQAEGGIVTGHVHGVAGRVEAANAGAQHPGSSQGSNTTHLQQQAQPGQKSTVRSAGLRKRGSQKHSLCPLRRLPPDTESSALTQHQGARENPHTNTSCSSIHPPCAQGRRQQSHTRPSRPAGCSSASPRWQGSGKRTSSQRKTMPAEMNSRTGKIRNVGLCMHCSGTHTQV